MTTRKISPMVALILVILLASCGTGPAGQPLASSPDASSDSNASIPSSFSKSSAQQGREDNESALDNSMSSSIKADKDILSKIDNKTPYDKLITTTIDLNAFLSLRIPPSWNPSLPDCPLAGYLMQDYVEKFPVQCLRKNVKGTVYSVQKVKQGGLLYVFYDLGDPEPTPGYRATSIWSWCYVTNLRSRKEFSSIIDDKSTIEDLEPIFMD